MRAFFPPGSRRITLLILFAFVMLFPLSMYAQFQAGNIFGKVQGKDGGVLPGVTVTLTGVAAPQTTVTDALGNFRFINLSPGTYALKAELSGYGSAVRTGISVRVAQNADVTMTLAPSVTESITVTAEAPLLDVRKTGTGIDVSKVELEKIPTGRDPWVIMQQTPGVLLDRINVGGSESGQQSGYVSKGSTSDQSSWNVDGVNITDVGALGSTPTYYDFDSFEEMQITTGGSDPRIKTPGIQMNFVTKRGTNDWRGSARWFDTRAAWQATPSIPAEAQSYLSRVNQINVIEDRGFELGGPILRDKLWVWGAFSRNNIDLLTATLLQSGQRFLDKTLLQNENLKVNAQLFPSNSLVVTDSYGNKVKLGRNASPSRPPETTWNQSDVYSGGGIGSLTNPTLWKAEDTQIFGSSLYLTGLYSQVQGGFHLVGDGGLGCQTFDCGLSAPVAYQDADGTWHRSFVSYQSVRPQSQARIDGSKFFDTGRLNHELKFGFGYRNASVQSLSAWPGAQYTTVCAGGCGDGSDTGAVSITRSPLSNFTYHTKYQDAYIGDTVVMGNLTLQGALRYDLQKGDVAAGSLGASPTIPDVLPAVSWPAISGLKWSNVSPRVGLTYALGAAHRTLLRASYNRYADQLGGSDVYLPAPGNYNYLYYYFKDLNGDHVAQRNEIDFAYGVAASNGVDPKNPTVPQQYSRWDKNFKAPTTDEIILGAEQELFPDFTVGINGTYRKLNDFSWRVGEHTQGMGNLYSSADYVLHAPVTATLPDGSKVSLPYYTLKSGVSSPTFYVIGNRPDYNQTYKGVDLSATKRLSNRWMLRANLTIQDWTQHVGAGAIVDPSIARSSNGACTVCDNSQVIVGAGSGSGAKGGVYINSKWAYNFTGTYQLPVIETSFGFNLTGRQGYPIPYVYRVSANDSQGGSFTYLLAEPKVDTHRNANVMELDLRLAKDIPIRNHAITLSVDGFNILNRQTILQRDVRRLQLGASNHITELQSPRVFRLGARVSF
jgi:Carboxypeptidase regulatory-like domain